MMESWELEEDKNMEENIIKDLRNLFRLDNLKKETNDAAINGIRNLFWFKKENQAIKDRIITIVRNLFNLLLWICCFSSVKSLKVRKRSTKNNKIETFYRWR